MISLFLYFAILLYFARLKSRQLIEEEYFFANRSFNSWIIALTCTASWFGGAASIVTVNKTFKNGFSAYRIVAGPTIISLIVLIFLAGRIRKLKLKSQPELMEKRYNQSARKILTVIVAWYMVTWVASQMVAVGKFFSGFFEIPYRWALIICVLVVYIYSLFGGFRAVVLTDVV